ncbi:MAG: glycosyltransferase [Anaerolineae bacterium]|nr:glycosyltransferase [Anaerolineae bacterium]
MLLISTIFFIAGLLILTWLHSQYQLDLLVEPAQAPKNAPLISVCVPARNEERNIEACVKALLAQTYPNFEVIILDERSTDSTPQIVERLKGTDSRINLIHGTDLPSGWAGKPHALLQASTSARGDWLCFVDADTFLEADALSSVYAKALESKADLFTMMTRQIMLTFWERTVLPLVMTALSVGFSPRKVNDPRRKDAIANGQFIFIKRSVYDAIGGHAAVYDSIVEDKDLASVVKGSGYRLVIADGQRMASTRMYTSLPEMWEGWTKNIYLGLRDEPGLMILGVFGAILAFAAAVLLPVWVAAGVYITIASPAYESVAILVESLLLWGYLLYWRILASRGMGIPSWYALTTPLGAAVFGAMMLTSAFKVISGKGVVWKGRRYKR